MRQKLFQGQRDVSSINKTRPIVSISYDRRETFTLCHSSNVRPLSLSSVIFEALWRYRFPSMKYTSDIDTPVTSSGSLGLFLSTILRIYGKGWRVVMRRRKYVSTDKAQETELPHCRHWIFFLPSCSLIFSLLSSTISYACDATFEEESNERFSRVSIPTRDYIRNSRLTISINKLLFPIRVLQ